MKEMFMKRVFGVLLVMAMVITFAQAASAELITQGSSLDAALLNYQPAPAQPGDELEVWIQISNDGGSASKEGTMTVLDAYPFTVLSDAERVKTFSSIPGQETFLIKTRVRVDKNANEGTNYLTIRIQEKGSESWVEQRMAISIQGRSSALTILEAVAEPTMIPPGGDATFTVTVKNVGDTRLRNVDLSLGLDDLSIIPTSGSNTQTIGSLAGGETKTFIFGLSAYPGAEANAYQIPITLSYEDEQGNIVSQEKTLGIRVGSEPELLVYFERNGLSEETMSGDVVIKFVNKGLSEIKLLEMEILESDTIEVTSESAKLYVGNIEVDDYESADISLKIGESHIELPIKVIYRDALNNRYEETYTLQLDAKNGNGEGGSGGTGWMILILVILGGVGFFWWRAVRAKKRRK